MKRSRRRTSVAVAVCFTAGFLCLPGHAAANGRWTEQAVERKLMTSTRPVVLSGVITGTLDLRGLGRIRPSFTCRNCDVLGGLLADGVVFENTLDLRGATIRGRASFAGATFLQPALFQTAFSQPADFSLATFEGLTSFERARFGKSAHFELTRFRSDASFASVTFKGTAGFAEATFLGDASFDGSRFDGPARFSVVEFAAAAHFQVAEFYGSADFKRASFGKGADLTTSLFSKGADFEGTTFAGDADFSEADFDGDPQNYDSPLSLTVEHARVTGALNLSGTTFRDTPVSLMQGAFGSVSLQGAVFDPGVSLVIDDHTSMGSLTMAVSAARRINDSDQERWALKLIESSAKASGDLGSANQARYRLNVLVSRHYSPPLRMLDLVFYRWIAGYLVRPLQPLLTLLALALMSSLIRVLRQPPLRAKPPPPSQVQTRRLAGPAPSRPPALSRFAHEFGETLALIWRRGVDPEGRPRLEAFVYRVLVVVALIGIGSSSPTLRQMLDALT